MQQNQSIRELQTLLKSREKEMRIAFTSLTKREKDILAKTVKLSEEVGEVANDILAVLSLQRKSKLDAFDKRNLYAEFADIMIATTSLANALGVDLDRAVQDKLHTILTKYIHDKQETKK